MNGLARQGFSLLCEESGDAGATGQGLKSARDEYRAAVMRMAHTPTIILFSTERKDHNMKKDAIVSTK